MGKIQGMLLLTCLFFFLYTPSKQSIHMYQQNRYQLLRYARWLCSHLYYKRKTIIKKLLCLLLSYGLLFVSQDKLPWFLFMIVIAVYTYIFFRIEQQQHYRLELVFTHRVKRQFIFTYLFYGVAFYFGYKYFTLDIWILLFPLLYFIPWIQIFMSGSLLKPIEKKIRLFFLRDAKKRLSEMDGLISIGISGSYGKTSVKTIVYHLLNERYYTLMTPNSYNNLMGITLTIRTALQHIHEVFLCEMGADHVHEITQLMNFVKPQYSIVTAIGPQHLSTFHTMENIIYEKMQMVEQLPSNGVGVLNWDNAYIRNYTIQNTCQIIRYGKHSEAEYRILNIHYSKKGSTFEIMHQNICYAFSTKLLGELNIMNITAGIAMAHTLACSWEMLQQSVRALEYVEHRLQVRESEAYTILDNAYNSNLIGASSALEVLQQMGGKRIIVTPGFLDLGEQSEQAHITFAKQIAISVDIAILVGEIQTKDIAKTLKKISFPLANLYVVAGIEEAFSLLTTLADKDSTVLLENDLPDAFNH